MNMNKKAPLFYLEKRRQSVEKRKFKRKLNLRFFAFV